MKTVAVFFGSRSTEHDVSVITALASIIKPLELSKKYRVEAVYIAKGGNWYWDEKLKDVSLFSSGKVDDFLARTQPVSLQFKNGLVLQKTSLGRSKSCKVDVAFPATHGTNGEDGSLMGLLRMANVPFVGCDMDAAVIAMDKVLAKLLATAAGIPTSRMRYASKTEYLTDPSAFAASCESLTYPLFVKPAHLGSSIGISHAKNRQELDNALEVAFHYDDKVLVEEEVPNLIEVTLPILGNQDLQPALLERPLTSSDDFFDFDTKYIRSGGKKGAKAAGGTKGAQGYSELPAKLDAKLYKQAEELGLNVYRALGCAGTARVDMLIDSKQGKVYFNEVNPLPGSLYAHNWRAAGVSGMELVEKLVSLAEERWQTQQQQNTVFTTSFLKQF